VIGHVCWFINMVAEVTSRKVEVGFHEVWHERSASASNVTFH